MVLLRHLACKKIPTTAFRDSLLTLEPLNNRVNETDYFINITENQSVYSTETKTDEQSKKMENGPLAEKVSRS